MRQRVAFLRTLLSDKPVLALDEPFASLDAITRGEMQEWLAERLAEDPRTVVLVTHDVEEALYLSDRVAVLSRRPALVVESMAAPAPRAPDRDAVVTEPGFVAARERAMHALREAAGSP
jgi:NitT/TauT family transport system ATP-binding protein